MELVSWLLFFDCGVPYPGFLENSHYEVSIGFAMIIKPDNRVGG